jgi:Bacterial TSP3 repeat
MTTRTNPPSQVAVRRSAGAVLAAALISGALLFPAPAIAIPDTDSDGLTDVQETDVYITNPNAKDSDGDVVNDGVEVDRGTDPRKPDTDGDALADGEENRLGTNPLDEDSDGDTHWDGWEVDNLKTDPNNPNSPAKQSAPAVEAPPAQAPPAQAPPAAPAPQKPCIPDPFDLNFPGAC